jgi:hypothetical protein
VIAAKRMRYKNGGIGSELICCHQVPFARVSVYGNCRLCSNFFLDD